MADTSKEKNKELSYKELYEAQKQLAEEYKLLAEIYRDLYTTLFEQGKPQYPVYTYPPFAPKQDDTYGPPYWSNPPYYTWCEGHPNE